MAKRVARPWDKGRDDHSKRRARMDDLFGAPTIDVDGFPYKSDRFYLHSLEGETPPPELPTCRCGSAEAPPLFSRETFLKSLDLKAAIFGTYTLDLDWMAKTFPHLVGPTSSVPTLILHGEKGLKKQLLVAAVSASTHTEKPHEESEEQNNSEPSSISVPLYTRRMDFRLPPFFSPVPEDDDASSFDGEGSIKTQEDCMSSPTAFSKTNTNSIRSPHQIMEPTTKPEPQNPRITLSNLGSSCHLTQIRSAWNPTADAKVSREEDNDAKSKESEYKFGVHHPKFMLLFETSGDLVVLVSTANLTKTRTLEGSWMQRFSLRRRSVPSARGGASSTTTNSNSTQNDFGLVLTDFLEKLSLAAMPDETKVDEFMTKHLSMNLKDLALGYHFEKSQVHLIPTIPGNWRGKPRKNQRHVYGRQRVSLLLSQIPDLIQSKKDKLLLQPTSFGGNWKRTEFADVVRSYMGYNRMERPKEYWNESLLLEKSRIVWPSDKYMRSLPPATPKKRSNPQQPDNEMNSSSTTINGLGVGTDFDNPIVFLSSQVFNSSEKGCLSRMARYEPSHPIQRSLLVPHFKSVARLLSRVSSASPKVPASDQYFSWFLLTSACFSLGAQGKGVASLEKKDHPVEYANFELGVLFTSRSAAKSRRRERIYCFHPTECSCNDECPLSSSTKLVHLPVPYGLHPKPYFGNNSDDDDEDDDIMQETPFFHEIEEGNRCVGNMLLTPYGREQQRKAEH